MDNDERREQLEEIEALAAEALENADPEAEGDGRTLEELEADYLAEFGESPYTAGGGNGVAAFAPAETALQVPTMAEWLHEAADARRWIVPGFIPEESLVLISGQQKRAWKTWFADVLALAISTGTPIGGMEVLDSRPVLYCQEEGSKAGTKNRIEGLCRSNGIQPDDLLDIHYAFHRRVKLDDTGWRKDLIDYCLQMNIGAVILDAVTYMHTGDENKISEMAPVVETVQELRALGISVVFLAHLDKMRGESPSADIDSQVRGSSIVANAYDVHLAFRRYKASDKNIQLIVRGREQEEKEYVVTWDLMLGTEDEETKLRRIEKVSLSVKEFNEGTRLELMSQTCYAAMLENQEYTLKTMYDAWNLGGSGDCKRVRELLIAQGLIEKNGTIYKKVV